MPTLPPGSTPPFNADAARENDPLSEELAPEEYYYEGPYLVFTAAYHIKRGYCCNSGCRHCPYGDSD